MLIIVLIIINMIALGKLGNTAEALVKTQDVVVKTQDSLKESNDKTEIEKKDKEKAHSSLKDEREKSKKLTEENDQLKVSLQAKEAKRIQRTAPKPEIKVAAVKVSGSKADWLAQSGIPNSQWGLADYLINKESSWNPNAVNKSSGACGLGQQLPCGKWAGAWNDPVAALRAMHSYVMARYGSWGNAVNHSKRVGWY